MKISQTIVFMVLYTDDTCSSRVQHFNINKDNDVQHELSDGLYDQHDFPREVMISMIIPREVMSSMIGPREVMNSTIVPKKVISSMIVLTPSLPVL